MSWRRWSNALGSTAFLAACTCSSGSLEYMDDDFPAGSCRGTSSDTGCETSSSTGEATSTGDTGAPTESGGGTEDACSRSDECPSGVCSAPVDAQAGPFSCVDTCIEVMDEASWCADAAACCDRAATCTPRGYCIVPEGTDTTGTEGSSTGSSSTGR